MIFGFGWEPLGNSFLSSFYDFKCKKICVQSSGLLLKHSVAHSFWRTQTERRSLTMKKEFRHVFHEKWKVIFLFSALRYVLLPYRARQIFLVSLLLFRYVVCRFAYKQIFAILHTKTKLEYVFVEANARECWLCSLFTIVCMSYTVHCQSKATFYSASYVTASGMSIEHTYIRKWTEKTTRSCHE